MHSKKRILTNIFVMIRSDGCGRTGTYLCIDANLEMAEEDGLYDVYGYTRRLKHARRGLIENIVNEHFFIMVRLWLLINVYINL